MTDAVPLGLLAELTHRCPLQCPYCSNPVALERRSAELDTDTWLRVLEEARKIGVLQVHLSGGEPTTRPDLDRIVGRCTELGLYSNLITSGVLLDERKLRRLADRGLDHLQMSIQHDDADMADTIAGFGGGHTRKIATARATVAAGIPLTINLVVHRRNLDSIPRVIDLAYDIGAERVEVAHTQYHGWAAANRAALMPTREQVEESIAVAAAAQERLQGRMRIDFVPPDYYARWPKACMGGWGKRALNVTPSGKVLPCHAAETIPGLDFWNVRDRALDDIWQNSPAFEAFRGRDWMQEPCTSCDRSDSCLGGCRCQALAIAGDAAAADPACQQSPHHETLQALAHADSLAGDVDYRYRH